MIKSINGQIALYLTTAVYLVNFDSQLATGLAIDQSPHIGNNLDQQVLNMSPRRQPEPASHRIDSRRPVWNLAHMVNSIKELDYRLG